MSDTPLQSIEAVLKEENFATKHIPVSKDHPFEQLYVSLGQDEQKRPYIIQMHFVNDVTNALGGQDEPSDAYILQLFIVFPFLVEIDQKDSVARLLTTLSRILPVGAFGMSDEDGTPFYQYNLACKERAVDEKVLLEVVSIMGFFSSEFGKQIEEVASGKKTREALLSELAEAGISFPPIQTATE